MNIKDSNVIIENDKVVFSQEILNYFEDLRNDETSEWINKYFKVLSDISNINSTKNRKHHIIPCFAFKDETHKSRKQTKILADELKENIIKISVENHIKAHYYLWKIFPKNEDARRAIYLMLGKLNINNLTESEIQEFAKIKEECAKENQTREERLKKQKEYKINHKEEIDDWFMNHKEEHKKYNKFYNDTHKEEISKNKKDYWKNNKEYIKKRRQEHDSEEKRKHQQEYNKKYYQTHKEEISYYRNINKDNIAKRDKEYRNLHKEEISEYNKNRYIKIAKQTQLYNAQRCIDPKKGDECSLCALKTRKHDNKELYKDVTPTKCIIKQNTLLN